VVCSAWGESQGLRSGAHSTGEGAASPRQSVLLPGQRVFPASLTCRLLASSNHERSGSPVRQSGSRKDLLVHDDGWRVQVVASLTGRMAEESGELLFGRVNDNSGALRAILNEDFPRKVTLCCGVHNQLQPILPRSVASQLRNHKKLCEGAPHLWPASSIEPSVGLLLGLVFSRESVAARGRRRFPQELLRQA
jgi:hypothetical protein